MRRAPGGTPPRDQYTARGRRRAPGGTPQRNQYTARVRSVQAGVGSQPGERL